MNNGKKALSLDELSNTMVPDAGPRSFWQKARHNDDSIMLTCCILGLLLMSSAVGWTINVMDKNPNLASEITTVLLIGIIAEVVVIALFIIGIFYFANLIDEVDER